MDTLWIFNPENDIALGNNLRFFTPPRNAILLRERGAMLPAWIAGDGDIILTSNPADADWLHKLADTLKKNIEILTPGNIGRVSSIRPWGWSHAIVESLARVGLSRHIMPDLERIERIRALSHRRSSVIINRRLAEAGFNAPVPIEFSDIGLLEKHLKEHQDVVVKSPWSSSGRGVIYSSKMDKARLLSLALGIIKNQGSVLVEPMLDKTIDFAMLFNIGGNGAEYIGLSIFNTLAGGNYSGNIVASEDCLTDIIGGYAGRQCLERLKLSLAAILTDLIGDAYSGVCGIDMMIYKDKDEVPAIAPCIELNLRHTMGYVSHCLARDILASGKTAEMNVSYIGNVSEPTLPPCQPKFDSDRRLTEGTLSLIPQNPDFAITLTVK